MRISAIYILLALSLSTFTAGAAVFNEPLSLYSTSRFEIPADSAMAFHEKRKMGVGTVFSGATGLLGAHLHFYIGPDFAVGVGYGGAENLKAFNAYFRELLTNGTFSFYWTAGYARWWNNGDKPITSTTPAYLHNRFLSASEKASGTFVEHIIYPGIGGQFYNMSGDFEGLSFYGEALLMTDVADMQVNPSLGIGSFFYF